MLLNTPVSKTALHNENNPAENVYKPKKVRKPL